MAHVATPPVRSAAAAAAQQQQQQRWRQQPAAPPPPLLARAPSAPAAAATGGRVPRGALRHQHHLHQQQQPWRRGSLLVAAAAGEGEAELSLEESFSAELAARRVAEDKAAEVAAAASFDGEALLSLLRAKYGRSYDVSLVKRTYLGKHFVALNVMWRYAEQQSFSYTRAEFMQRLDHVAAALVSWGAVSTVRASLAATKERPRVGKAVSIMLQDVSEDQARAWIAR